MPAMLFRDFFPFDFQERLFPCNLAPSKTQNFINSFNSQANE